ncbi:TPA: hypothetical protein NM844_000911 [Salmonella enterica]|nr:hypothetical protein [Salmonella enterica]
MKDKIRFFLFLCLISGCYFIIFSDCQSLSVIVSFLIIPVMIYFSGKYKKLTFLLPLSWCLVLLYPVFLVLLDGHTPVVSVFYYFIICGILSAPLSFFILTSLSCKYRFVSPFVYVILLYCFKADVFQVLPVIMVFQSDVFRHFVGHSVSPWVITLALLYFSLSLYEIIIRKYKVSLCYFLTAFLFFLPAGDSRYHYSVKNVKVAGIQLSRMMGENTDLNDIITYTDDFILKNPDVKMVVYSESPWLGFKSYNNQVFTERFIHHLIKRSAENGVIYIFQVDSLKLNKNYINKVLTVKAENGELWYTGKSHLVPGWERGITDGGGAFSPEKHKMKFRAFGSEFKTLICYDALFMPSFFDRDYDVALVQSNYGVFREVAGVRAYNHMIKISNILSWFSGASNGKVYINVENEGGSTFAGVNSLANERMYFDSPQKKSFIVMIGKD